MSKSEQIRQKLLKRAEERRGTFDDFEGFRKFLDAIVEEALVEKAKREKEKLEKTQTTT